MAKFISPLVAVNLNANDASPQHSLGTEAITVNGEHYRYIKNGATAIVVGKLYDCPASVANHTNIAVAAAAAIGALTVTVTLGGTAATANQYAGGTLTVNDVTGEGYTYHIKSHPAANASASLVLTLDDDDPIRVALTTSSEVTLIADPYNAVIVHAATETGIPAGIGVAPITAAYYGWIKTRGVISALSDATVSTLGDSIAASATTEGAVTVGTGVLSPIGYSIVAGVSTEYRPIFLTID